MKKPAPPLTPTVLEELALAYVSRFATTRAKLTRYLDRKLFERGWTGDAKPDVAAIAERLAQLRYVDDAAFADMKARSLSRRGYGARRVDLALRAAGVRDVDRADAVELSEKVALDAAIRFARRRRWGPFGDNPVVDPRLRQRMLAAFIRAGHGHEVARMIISLAPGTDVGDLMGNDEV